MFYEQNNEQMANVFHAKRASGITQVAIDALVVNVDALVDTYLLPEMTEDSQYLRTEARALDDPNDFFATSSTNAGPGTIASAGLPTSVTFSLKKGSGQTGRSARGRWYFVGMALAALATNENIVLTAEVASMISAVNNIRAGLTDGGWVAVIASRYFEGALRSPGITFPWTSVVAVDETVDTQRRRLG